jgi:hypothetical protein
VIGDCVARGVVQSGRAVFARLTAQRLLVVREFRDCRREASFRTVCFNFCKPQYLRVCLVGCAFCPLLAADKIVNPMSQAFHSERLGHYVHAWGQMPMAKHSILGVAGDKQHLQVRAYRPRGVR